MVALHLLVFFLLLMFQVTPAFSDCVFISGVGGSLSGRPSGGGMVAGSSSRWPILKFPTWFHGNGNCCKGKIFEKLLQIRRPPTALLHCFVPNLITGEEELTPGDESPRVPPRLGDEELATLSNVTKIFLAHFGCWNCFVSWVEKMMFCYDCRNTFFVVFNCYFKDFSFGI